MLQFLKKSGRKKSLRSSPGNDQSTNNGVGGSGGSENNQQEEIISINDAEKYCNGIIDDDTSVQTKSKLSRNLLDILLDKSCLCYFVQFLETKQALQLLKFWLDVESFRTASEMAINKPSTPPADGRTVQPQITQNRYKNELETISNISTDDLNTLSTSSKKTTLSKSVSSDCYDNLSYNSFDCDYITTTTSTATESPSLASSSSSSQNTNCGNSGDNIKDNTDNNQNQNDWRSLTDDEKFQQIQVEIDSKSTTISNNIKFQSTISSDAIRIYRKYLITNSSYSIDVPATILSNISLGLCPPPSLSAAVSNSINSNQSPESPSSSSSSSTSPHCFDDAQKLVFDRLEQEYLNPFLESEFYCKFTIDTLTSTTLTLNDILQNEATLFYLMEFLEQENKRYYLDFLISANNFRHQLNLTQTQIQSDAMILYEKYFSLQATNSLNISDTVRYCIEENICKETGSIISCFDHPIKIVEYYLERNYFKNFIKSQLFYKYLSELFNKIQNSNSNTNTKNNNNNNTTNDHNNSISISSNTSTCNNTTNITATNTTTSTSTTRTHRKTFSDCSNDKIKKYQTKNTLLAMESNLNKNKQKLRSSSTSDMHIDSRQLYNPDLLWYRSKSIQSSGGGSGLSFGRIDSLGRYEREYELDTSDDKWSLSFNGNKLKNAVKKLVNVPEDKIQEELAWQVAEMIVKDITNVTLKLNK